MYYIFKIIRNGEPKYVYKTTLVEKDAYIEQLNKEKAEYELRQNEISFENFFSEETKGMMLNSSIAYGQYFLKSKYLLRNPQYIQEEKGF